MKRLSVLPLAFFLLLVSGVWLTRSVEARTLPGNDDSTQVFTDGETVITLGDPIAVSGSGVVVTGTTATITAGGSYRATGTLADGMIDIDTTEAVTLTLDGVTLTHTTGSAICVTNAEKLLLVLASGTSNTLTDGATYSDTDMKSTLFSNDTLEISGDGVLTITGNYKHGIASDDDLIISGGDITIVSTVKDGFHANDLITVFGGTIDIDAVGSDGFESEGDFMVTGGTLTVVATGDGIKSANAITVTDGQIYIDATGDAMDSGGALVIEGGVIVALGGGSGLACGDGYEVTLNSGTVVATGSANSTPSGSSTQYIAVLGSQSVGTALYLERDDGTDVLTFEVSKAYQSMLFTSTDLLGSRTYTAYKGGSISGGTDFHGLYTGATYSGGTTWAIFTTDSVVTSVTDLVMIYLPLVMAEGDNGTTPSGETVITLGSPITVDGSGVDVSGTTATITAGGSYRATGTLADGMIAVDTTEAVTLTLDGVTLTHVSGPAINVASAEKLLLVLAEGTSNTLSDGAIYSDEDLKSTLFSNDPLEISGNGALAITGNYKHGIASDDNLIISGGDITIVSAVTDGFHANDDITISGGTIDIVAVGSDGFESEGTFVVTGGTLTLAVADDGLIGADTVTISGGTIEITSGVEGIESKNAIVINDGTITIVVSDDGLNATNDITINGGQIYINATADAVDSNGTLNFNGGVTVALGGNTPEGGLDCDQCSIALNGGTVVATGGANSTPSNSSAQRVAVLGTRPTGTVIHIERNDGTDVLTFGVSKAYQSMIFTSSTLLANKSHTVYTGGSVSGGTNFHGLYTGATYSGGTTWATFTTNSVVTTVGGGPTPPGP